LPDSLFVCLMLPLLLLCGLPDSGTDARRP